MQVLNFGRQENSKKVWLRSVISMEYNLIVQILLLTSFNPLSTLTCHLVIILPYLPVAPCHITTLSIYICPVITPGHIPTLTFPCQDVPCPVTWPLTCTVSNTIPVTQINGQVSTLSLHTGTSSWPATRGYIWYSQAFLLSMYLSTREKCRLDQEAGRQIPNFQE